jgi:phosphoribosylformylglycinamidine cyclo-ligase
LDPGKILGQEAARSTFESFRHFHPGWSVEESFLGESCSVIQTPFGYSANLLESLGTKIRLAEMLRQATNSVMGFRHIGFCNLAMIVNDMITVGILPHSFQLFLGVGAGEWFQDLDRLKAFYEGVAAACIENGIAWTGGESPCLTSEIFKDGAVIAGSCGGILMNEDGLPWYCDVENGDVIIGTESNGFHANGYTLLRKVIVASSVVKSRSASSKRLLKEASLPTKLYAKHARALRKAGISPSYVVNVTGHWWSKIARAKRELTYRITHGLMFPTTHWFRNLQRLGNIAEAEMWKNYNMGIGMVWFFRPAVAAAAIKVLQDCDDTHDSHILGGVEEGQRQVVFDQVGMEPIPPPDLRA